MDLREGGYAGFEFEGGETAVPGLSGAIAPHRKEN